VVQSAYRLVAGRPFRLRLWCWAGGVSLSLLPAAALAQTGPFDEVRFGVLYHDVLPIYSTQREDGIDLNGELYFVSPVPDSWLTDVRPTLRWLLRPRPSFGFDANTAGATSQLYVSAVWTVALDNGDRLWRDGTVFMDFGVGPAYNTGHVASRSSQHLSLGSNALFHLSVDLGVRLTCVLSTSIYFEHSSNAGLAPYNPGLNNVGLRMGFRF